LYAQGLFIEHAHVHANIYGTSTAAVKAVCDSGKICVLDIDVQGVKAVVSSGLAPKRVYIAPPSHDALEERLRSR
jgi:guanylate kinase